MSSIDLLAEIRAWIALSLGTIGGAISIRTYVGNQKQRRLENSFRMLAMFKESLREGDIEAWEKIFYATSESAGAKKGSLVDFVDLYRYERPLSDLFSEGSPDNGAVNRMAELFDLISEEILERKLEVRLIYFQLGQLMDSVHSWLTKIDNPHGKTTFLEENFPSFDRVYKQKIINNRWASRTYSHIN